MLITENNKHIVEHMLTIIKSKIQNYYNNDMHDSLNDLTYQSLENELKTFKNEINYKIPFIFLNYYYDSIKHFNYLKFKEAEEYRLYLKLKEKYK